MKFKIVADSSANLIDMEGVDFAYAPLHVLVGDEDFVDDDNIDTIKMQQALDAYKGKTSTSCPSTADWLSAFGDADYVFGTSITSGLSGSYASSQVAKGIYEETNPGKKVFIADSLSTGPEMVLILEKFKELIDAGVSPEDIEKEIKEYQKKTHLYFALASLNNFAKNGRINPIIAKGIGILGIRVVGKPSEVGELQPTNKKRGDKSAFACFIKHMREDGYTNGKVIISHTQNEKGAKDLKELVEKEFGVTGVRIMKNKGLCSYYAEPESVLIGYEA